MREKLHIYHTNDLHSHFENWPAIVDYIGKQRQKHTAEDEEVLLFDIGDHVDRFHPISEATFGKANVELLNRLRYDAVTIGNNEGITLPHEELDALYRHAEFPVIVSNLFDTSGNRPSWAEPYWIKTLKSGITIAVLGVTVPYYPIYAQLDWKVTDAFESIARVLKEVKGKADITILLSHLGILDDQKAAERFPEIDLILGSHTHHLLEDGMMKNGVLLACAEKYGNYAGHVELTVDLDRRTVFEKKASVQKTSDWNGESEETSAFLMGKMEQARTVLREEVAQLDHPITAEWFQASALPQMLADALKEWCNAEIGMVNAGILLGSLSAGPVTRGDIHRICPHPINPVKVKLTGTELKETVLQASAEEMEQLHIKGLGFRGKVMGKMMYSGLDAEKLAVAGAEIEPGRTYTLATIDMFTLGTLFPAIRDACDIEYFMPEFLRDLLAWKLDKACRGDR
ncbi:MULTISPECIES: bifunctional metallophosphatase/5'-nucleotidase [Bacillus]|uniref:Bifunctional metallophosphatase/5'-nucleotidase n=1 Tax=Bacillus glycinifermentans TaxID=1664069 RepID=A0AAJ4D484_9BACI|nr:MULTISPECIES: bifunctional UDP-sugar hydrolase/5'-nucleotidase [Bacillus]KKB72941.1 5'-nucleotidase [Bacillus sp. TH008]MBU8785381.1 bifunctional metallophosphatase/5'-nucleotidase [Bacillus glycinifermentans]MDU0072969.1 bifunctional UDP-sugar hydrolase/5'-nucleotidase [Bacillus sp. IG6]MED8020728.1 bifunctional UDP-sugar hydrolase/5'-nucleotidase [Bacillus glycinifermentans]NUJ15705.1 bifunctional metallophosphatase/5'-nucleotidase [Bacillus glycinifermentans]